MVSPPYHVTHRSSWITTATVFIWFVSLANGQSCEPQNCIVSEWLEWSECSESCGDSGVRQRIRYILSQPRCGGICPDATSQSEPCNIRCCPQNCEFSPWGSWGSCRCDVGIHCDFEKIVCVRIRKKETASSCGGYCDGVIYDARCGKPCCYKDCITAGWAAWGACDAACEQEGRRFRDRNVIQEPACGGKRCKLDTDAQTCTGPCCPQDCVMGDWSEWSECPAVCGEAIITRSRFIQPPVCGGAECPETDSEQSKTCVRHINGDCKMGPWSSWSVCELDNGLCGQGSKTRERAVLVDQVCQGEPCQNLTETAVCSGPCCVVDCEVGEWSEYGHCSTDCGEGIKNRTREILVEQKCGGAACPDLLSTATCTVVDVVDCRLTTWSEWSTCSNDCGTGTSLRTRTLLTPAYCGGRCEEQSTVEEKECESYSARTDCAVGQWSEWDVCIRNCDTGLQRRSRSIAVREVCGGEPCLGKYELAETRPCHEKCSQLCNQGVCSCEVGYGLDEDGISCSKKNCGYRRSVIHCAPGTKLSVSCVGVSFTCQSTLYNSTCPGKCKEGWVIKGQPTFTKCQDNGKWSEPKIFCGPENKPPLGININTTEVSELLDINECFAQLTTEGDNEAWDTHTYTVIDDPSGVLSTKNDYLCVKTKLDFETSEFRKWNATIKSEDLDGLSVSRTFSFTLINNNDPPKFLTLSPNEVPENSPQGTEIGCFNAVDDDPGQTLKMYLLTKEDMFEMFQKDQKYCLKVAAVSDPDCSKLGGEICALNHEKEKIIYFAAMVQDDAEPPLSTFFELQVTVTDINEPITGVTFSQADVPENIPPGQPLVTLKAQDEDVNDVHTFEILEDSSGLFQIVNNTLVSTVSLDYESDPKKKFSLKIKVTDVKPPQSQVETAVTFGVQDINEPPFKLLVTSSNAILSFESNKPRMWENMPGEVIGTVSVIDPDAGDSVDLTLDDEQFTIKDFKCTTLQVSYNYCSGKLVHRTGFNYEKEPIVKLKITARDKFFHLTELEVDIQVLDRNDPPSDILIDGNITDRILVPENSRSFSVATLTVADEDENAEDQHAFFLSGNASSRFQIKDTLLLTTEAAGLDFESPQSMTLVITAVDTGQTDLTVTKPFNIVVTDLNEAPLDILFSNTEIPENSKVNTLVSLLSTEDPDHRDGNQQGFVYELLNDSSGRFYMEGNKLFTTTSSLMCGATVCSLDYEAQRDLLIEVRVTDDGEPSQSLVKRGVISLNDVNDPPHDIRLSNNKIQENKVEGSIVGSIYAKDQDVGDSFTITLLNSTNDFEILAPNYLVQLSVMDYETASEHFIRVQIKDDGSPPQTATTTLLIQVIDVNEPPSFLSPVDLYVAENSDFGTLVAELTVLDPDNQDIVEMALLDYQDMFKVTSVDTNPREEGGTLVTAKLVTQAVLDYEHRAEYSLGLTMKDGTGLEAVTYLKIHIEDENDPPQDILLDGLTNPRLTVREGETRSLATLTVIDQDRGQIHALKILEQASSKFELINNRLSLIEPLDFEATPEVTVILEAWDNGTPSYNTNKSVTLEVLNVNEPPSALDLTSTEVLENSIDGTEVGVLIPADPEKNSDFEFSLLDDDGGRFRIDNNKLLVVSPAKCISDESFCSLNFESQPLHTIEVMVSDTGFSAESVTFPLQISVADANDAPRDLTLSQNTVAELAEAGTMIGQLSVNDEDLVQSHSFTLIDSADGQFRLDNGQTLVKATDARLDISTVYSVTVRVEDNGIPMKSVENTFYISISGVSEVPYNLLASATDAGTQIDVSTLGIREDAKVGDVIAVLSAEDNDLDQTISVSLLVDGEGTFAVDSDTKCAQEAKQMKCQTSLLLSQPLDFETKSKFTIIMLATDSLNGQASMTLIIMVTDVGEMPTDIVFNKAAITVHENSRDVVVGKFSAKDEDKDDFHTFSLEDEDQEMFVLSPSGQFSVAPGASIDYETKNAFELTVRVADSSENVFNKIFAVNTVNVNEMPAEVKLNNSIILEGSSTSTVIGQLTTDDPDNRGLGSESGKPQTFSYVLLDDASGRFYLDQTILKLTSRGAECSRSWCGLDFETQSTHEIQIQVTDSGLPTLTATFTLAIQVGDDNDAPVLQPVEVTQIKENVGLGYVIAPLSALDQDIGQSLVFAIGSEAPQKFHVDNEELVVAGDIDYEDNSKVSVQIVVTDNGSPPKSSQATFEFEIVNVDEAPSSVTLERVTGSHTASFEVDQPVVEENAMTGSLIGQLVVIDPDNDEDISIVILTDTIQVENPRCLTLTKGTRCVANVLLGKVLDLDFEKQSSFSLDVTVIDKAGLQLVKTFQFQVVDKNDPPQMLLINGEDVDTLNVKENSKDITVTILGVMDEDNNQTFSYSLSKSSLFYVVGNELKVTAAANLDYERIDEVIIRVKVTDSGTPPMFLEKEVLVKVLDENEAPSSMRLTRNKVAEDSAAGTEIGSFLTSDPDNRNEYRQIFTYDLAADADGLFAVVDDMLVVAKAELDYEVKTSHIVRVVVTDSGTPQMNAEFDLEITVVDANDPPINLQLSAFSVYENASVGTEVGTLSAEDPDIDQSISYTVLDSDLFSIEENQLLVSGVLDFETSPTMNIQVKAIDNGVPLKSVIKTFSVALSDANDSPLVMEVTPTAASGNFEIPENSEVGSVLATVKSLDPDMVDYHSFHIMANSEKYFKLDAAGPDCTKESTGTVCTQDILLAEPVNFKTSSGDPFLEIMVIDKGQLNLTDSWAFRIIDSNDAPHDIVLDTAALEVPENDANFKLGPMKCIDADVGQKHVFQIITHWDIFRVDHGSVLSTYRPLDAEDQAKYKVTIRCVDDGEPEGSFSKTFTLKVKDVNEPPSNIRLSHSEVAMTAQDGDIVGIITVTDPDNEGSDAHKQTHTCSIDETGSKYFRINTEENTLKVMGSVPVEKESVLVTVDCRDDGEGQLHFIKDFIIYIVETADVPKTIVLMGEKLVIENTVDEVIGTFMVINELTQTEIDGTYRFFDLTTAETDIDVFLIEGNKLISKSSVDFETTPVLTISLNASGLDSKGNQIDLAAIFQIKAVDVNEAPEQIGIYGGGVVEENSRHGTVIGDLNTVDPEPYQTYQYTLISVAAGVDIAESAPELMDVFEIHGRTLRVGPNASLLNFETTPTFSLVVQSMDSGTPSLGLNYTLRVVLRDINDAPFSIGLDASVIPEDAQVGQLVGRLTVEDEDRNQAFRCIVNNLQNVPFQVQNDVDLVVAKVGLDYEGQRTYAVEITCQDEGQDDTHLKITKILSVNVTDVNEAPYDIQLSQSDIDEGNVIGQLVADISATDPDSKQIFFELDTNSSSFSIQGHASLMAEHIFDYEKNAEYAVTVKAMDEQGLFSLQTFMIKINNLNEKATAITLSNNVISEDAKRGTLIGTLRADDPDAGQSFLFKLTEISPANGHFVLIGDRLEVGESKLDFELASMYRVSITVTDNGTPTMSYTEEFDIEITDANEPPTEVTVRMPLSVEENTAQKTVLSNVTVIDEEAQQVHSCQILTENVPFTVNTGSDGSAELMVSGIINYEQQSTYDLKLSCSDGEFSIEKDVLVNVKDMNEPPTSISMTGPKALPAMSSGEYEVGELQVVDQDIGQTHTFSTSGPNSDLLKVKEGNRLILIKPLSPELLKQPNPTVDIIVVVGDSGQPTLTYTETLSLPITGIDLQALKLPEITIDNIKISEDAEVGTIIGEIYDINKTVGNSVIFSIVDDQQSFFTIQDNKYLALGKNISTYPGNSAQVTVEAKIPQTQETKNQIVTIIITRSDACYDNGMTCHDSARCIKLNDTAHECQCVDDFEGNGYSCQQIDDCVEQEGHDKCVNGVCIDDVNTFVCQCRNGFTGQLCEVPPPTADPCEGHSCQNQAICKRPEEGKNYTCICNPGWTGSRCETSINDCDDQSCARDAQCIDRHLSFICECPKETLGHRCQFFKTSCQDSNCEGDLECIPKVNVEDSICNPPGRKIQLRITCQENDTMEACQSRFFNFIEQNGRFPSHATSISPVAIATSRRRRNTNLPYSLVGMYRQNLYQSDLYSRERRERSSKAQNEVSVFSHGFEDLGDGTMLVIFTVMDSQSVPFTEEEMLASLAETCDSIAASNQNEADYCPSIQKAFTDFKEEKPKTPTEKTSEDGLPLPIIAGAAGGGVVLIIIIVVVVCLVRRKKSVDNSANTEKGRAPTVQTSQDPQKEI